MPFPIQRFTSETRLSFSYLLGDLARMARARNYLAWQYKLVSPYLGGRLVEVGCGTGNLTGYLMRHGEVIAVDIQPECVRRVRARFRGSANLRVELCGPPDEAFLELQNARPDACVCLNVLEHVERDVNALAAMGAILPPGGAVIVLVPAFEALYGPIDFQLGHYRRYTRRSLAAAAEAAGLEVTSARYVNLPGFFAWWLNAKIFRRSAQSEFQIAVFDRFLAPLAARMERILPPPFGQSLLAILQKRAATLRTPSPPR